MKKATVFVITLALVIAMMPLTAMAATTVTTSAELTDALAAGGDVALGADIDAGDLDGGAFFTVPGGITATLDLNGHTLQGTRILGAKTGSERNTAIIGNNGTLTIKDSVGGGQIVIDTSLQDDWNSCTAAVSNLGTLNMQSGTLLNNGGTNMAFAVDNLSGNPVLNVSGGLLKSVNYIAIRQFTNSLTMTNTVNISGGTVYGYKRGIWIQQPSASNGLGTLNISGGTVEATQQAAVQVDLLGTDGIDISVTGGFLINHCDTRATLALTLDYVPTAGGGYVYINGGRFTNTGTAGNIGDETTGGTATPSVIKVYAGIFSTAVPVAYIPADANPANILDGTTDVSADIDPTYTIVIPASVDFGTLVKGSGNITREFDVTAQDVVIETGHAIDVSVTSDFEMACGTTHLGYQLYNGSTNPLESPGQFAEFTGNGVQNGSVKVDTGLIQKAGSYLGTMVFTITYKVLP